MYQNIVEEVMQGQSVGWKFTLAISQNILKMVWMNSKKIVKRSHVDFIDSGYGLPEWRQQQRTC